MAETKVTSTEIEVQQGWIAPTLVSSWVNFGSPYATAGYMKDSLGFVHIKGMVKSGATNSTIFTLPAGYRPLEQLYFTGIAGDAISTFVVNTTGVVTAAFAGSPGWVALNGLTFKAEQ